MAQKEMIRKVDTLGNPPFEKKTAHISMKIGSTQDTLKYLKPIITQVLTKNEATIVFVQKKGQTFQTYIQSNSDYIYVESCFSFGYKGTGCQGLVELLKQFNQYNIETLEKLVYAETHADKAYIEIPFT